MKTCLVVDDGPLDREILKCCALSLGFNVKEASSGEEAIAICQGDLPDYILLDWNMGVLNGINVLQTIREMEGGDRPCILICTSNDHASFIGHAYVKGANGYLVKPITSGKLTAKLEELSLAA